MSIEITDWLRGLGLEQYTTTFRDNDIDAVVLPRLTAEDLRELGVTSVGHRRRLLDAIAALGAPALAANAPGRPAETIVTLAPKGEAERRQLTVMFCDLVDSTALASRLDPENLRGLIGAYHRCVAETVARFDGFVAKYMGDGVLVYFGYPQAHEDDAESAVRASLAITEAVGQLQASERLRVRVGIATGLVVVGDLVGTGAAQEHGIVGEPPNLAARLQAMAEPNTVVISASTRRLTGGLFEYSKLGAVAAKGFAEPVQAWRVLREGAAESRFEAFHAAALTPFVGREEEIELLLRRWAQAQKGEGRVVLLSGEPGIGKSRLAKTVQERIESEPHVRLRYFCSPFFRDSALHPTIARLERTARFEREDTPETKLGKLEAQLAPTTPPQEDMALLADLLSLPAARYPPLNLSPQRKKEKTFEALLRQIEQLARQQPVLMMYEDVHWIDPSSRELLDLVVERVQRLPVLLLITFRPEFEPPWIGLPHVTMHPLSRLDRREGASLVQLVAGNKRLPDEILGEIVARTDGVPLFVEELTKATLEAGADAVGSGKLVAGARPPSSMVPATLHASLMARLDRLGTAKEIAQIGATIGREFSFELLTAVASIKECELDGALAQLVASGLMFQRGVPPQATFLFKHALVQDAAYGTLLRSTRQALHARIAQAILERSPDAVETQPELLAHHLTEAGLAEPAIAYWRRAGERASRRSANLEAIAHLSKGLGLVMALPDTPQRAEAEFALQMAIGGPMTAIRGYSSSEVERTYLRARELSNQLGRSSELFPVLRGLWNCYFARGELLRGYDLAEQLAALAEEDEPLRRALACRALGSTLFFLGRFGEARGQLEKAIAFDEAVMVSGNRRAHISLHSDSPGVVARLHLSCNQWLLGFPDAAVATLEAGLALGEELAHAHFRALALSFAAIVHQWRREFDLALRRAEAAIAVAREHGLVARLALGTICRGAALARLGQFEDGIAELYAGFAGWHGTGARLYSTMWLGFTAEAHAAAGQCDAAFAALDRATEIGAATAESFYQIELHRLRGALHQEQGDHTEAQQWLEEAIDLARSKAARSLELRASTNLARLWRDQGRDAEARDLLAPVYGWFTEGFDTPDLKETKALLDQLA